MPTEKFLGSIHGWFCGGERVNFLRTMGPRVKSALKKIGFPGKTMEAWTGEAHLHDSSVFKAYEDTNISRHYSLFSSRTVVSEITHQPTRTDMQMPWGIIFFRQTDR